MNWQKIKSKVKDKYVETKTKAHVFYINHEEQIWKIGVVAVPAAFGLGKAISKSYNAHLEERHRLLTQYDHATGYYNQLKRPLTSSDWDRIMTMKRLDNITLTECLIRLGLTKN